MGIPQMKLLALLEHARQSTIYYANLLPPLTPSVNPIEILHQLPPLSKQALRQQKVRLSAVSGDTTSWHIARTSGTTGEPIEIILDGRSHNVEMETFAGHFDKCLDSNKWRTRNLVHLALHDGARSYSSVSPWNSRSLTIKWNLFRTWQLDNSTFLESVKSLDGQVITAMPSVAELICDRIVDGGASIRPMLFSLSGETVEAELVNRISRTLECPVTSLYITTEAGIIGRACSNIDEYHIAEEKVFVEILVAEEPRNDVGIEGDIVVTPLDNYAMPLLRYRTGDRGFWVGNPCNCGNQSPRIKLARGRRLSRLVNDGAGLNVIRFAKLFGLLDLERFGISQTEDASVNVSYFARRALDATAMSIIEAAMRSALGPTVEVQVRRVSDPQAIDEIAEHTATQYEPKLKWSELEPDGSDLGVLTPWLKQRLINEEGISYAVLTGSAIHQTSTTRFSDVDLVILVNGADNDSRWLELTRDIRRRIPKISINIDRLAGLSERAPLVTCRLLKEQVAIFGDLNSDILPWPALNNLADEARLWTQQTQAVLWHHLTTPQVMENDVVRAAWLCAKIGLTALRYRYLMTGLQETAPYVIMERAKWDSSKLPWLEDFRSAFDVAREHTYPPITSSNTIRSYQATAWFAVKSTAACL